MLDPQRVVIHQPPVDRDLGLEHVEIVQIYLMVDPQLRFLLRPGLLAENRHRPRRPLIVRIARRRRDLARLGRVRGVVAGLLGNDGRVLDRPLVIHDQSRGLNILTFDQGRRDRPAGLASRDDQVAVLVVDEMHVAPARQALDEVAAPFAGMLLDAGERNVGSARVTLHEDVDADRRGDRLRDLDKRLVRILSWLEGDRRRDELLRLSGDDDLDAMVAAVEHDLARHDLARNREPAGEVARGRVARDQRRRRAERARRRLLRASEFHIRNNLGEHARDLDRFPA
jgi:hypothetical protein